MPERAVDLLKQGLKLWGAWLKEWWKQTILLLLAATTAFVISAGNAETARRLEYVAVQTHSVLCTFKDNLQGRYDDTVRFLDNHAGREPIPGLTRADFRRSLQSQRATLRALEGLDCTINGEVK